MEKREITRMKKAQKIKKFLNMLYQIVRFFSNSRKPF